MREIGSIKQVQVQCSRLKLGQKPHEYYDPTPLLVVSRLHLTPRGVIGITSEGEQIIDIHNASHSDTRQEDDGSNGISLGFSCHYEAMRAKFGTHLVDGIAGENILVETEQTQTQADLGPALAIRIAATGQFVYLKDIVVAAPCVPFSRFAAEKDTRLSNAGLKEALQFLNDGCRGFYATLGSAESAFIQAGDVVFALD